MFKMYEAKPRVVEAIQFVPENHSAIVESLRHSATIEFTDGVLTRLALIIDGAEFDVELGDWIVWESQIDVYYPVKDEIFREHYIVKGD